MSTILVGIDYQFFDPEALEIDNLNVIMDDPDDYDNDSFFSYQSPCEVNKKRTYSKHFLLLNSGNDLDQ